MVWAAGPPWDQERKRYVFPFESTCVNGADTVCCELAAQVKLLLSQFERPSTFSTRPGGLVKKLTRCPAT